MMRFRGRVAGAVWGAVTLVMLLAATARWLDRWRLPSPDRAGSHVYHVTSPADSGPGSLRDGIFAADRADGRARISIDVARIALRTPLPPLLNPAGIVIDAQGTHAVLDAGALASGPVIDVATPKCVITGIRIERARGEAFMVRGHDTRLADVSVADSEIGVYQIDAATDLTIEASAFERNTVGVQTASEGWPVTIRASRFENNRRAAIWAVRPQPSLSTDRAGLDVVRTTFTGDRQAVVVMNVATRIQRSTFAEVQAAAVYVTGGSAIVAGNRMRSGRNFGIYLERVNHSLVTDNELDHNCSGGVMLKNSENTQVSLNRVYSNGYGIVVVHGPKLSPNTVTENLIAQHAGDGMYVIGASPIVRRNRLLQNRKAALHLSSLSGDEGSELVIADPLLDGNVLDGNGVDAVRDMYVPGTREVGVNDLGDCSWRRGSDTMQVARAGGGR